MSYLLESESGLDWPGKKNSLSNKTRKQSIRSMNSYELLHVFVILFFTKLKRAKFSFWRGKISGESLNKLLVESGSGLDWTID